MTEKGRRVHDRALGGQGPAGLPARRSGSSFSHPFTVKATLIMSDSRLTDFFIYFGVIMLLVGLLVELFSGRGLLPTTAHLGYALIALPVLFSVLYALVTSGLDAFLEGSEEDLYS